RSHAVCRRMLLLHTFLFSGVGYHRVLHSFPTRRSSDLVLVPEFSDGHPGEPLDLLIRCCFHPKPPWFMGFARRAARPHRNLRARSEEHTSELQSRENLVCRLLLEKKKHQQAHPQELAPA